MQSCMCRWTVVRTEPQPDVGKPLCRSRDCRVQAETVVFKHRNVNNNVIHDQNLQTKGNNSARQTRDTTTKTSIAHGNSTWHASKYKIHKYTTKYILKKRCPQRHIYPPFQAHSVTQACIGIRQNQFLFETRHSP